MPPRELGLRVALAGLAAYQSGAAAVANSNLSIKQSALDAAQGGSALDAKTVALGVALGNLASGGVQMALNGLQKLGQSLWGMAKEAGPVAGLKMAFEGLAEAAGSSGPEMLAALREATGGMAPMKDMMMTFNKGAQLISLDFAKTMPEAMKYLGKVAYATGTDMNYLMQSLVVGVGRMSPMILDNLAIQVKLSDATARAAEMFGVEEDALTKTQQQMGMMNVVLEKLRQNTANMPDVAGSATTAIQSLGAMLADFRTELGIATLPLLSEWTGVLTRAANIVLPRVIKAVQAVMGPIGEFTAQIGDAIEPLFRLADAILGTIGPAFSKMMQSLEPLREQIGNWVKLIGVRLSSIVDLITGTVGPGVMNLAGFFENAFDRIGQTLQRGGNLFMYLLRVVDDVMVGIKASLEGNADLAQKSFANAWQTALAVVITVLKNAVGAVVSWGRALVESYATGIVQGIKEFLSAALQAVAGFIRSWMAPGSPPKFLPDIGKWGTGAMNVWVKGMTEADFDMIAGITGQVRDQLAKMVDDGKLKVRDFGKTFGRIRAALVEVTDHFRKTGEIASDKLDIMRQKLGKTGEALAELTEYQLQYVKATEALDGIRKKMGELEDQEYELDKALRPYLDALEELRAKEQDARDEAYELYESGQIGAEEYEDRVKAIQEEREAAERVVREQEKAQRDQRTAIRDQRRELEDQERVYQRQAEQLQEEIGLLEARLGFHRETKDIQEQQKQMAEAMAKAMGGVAAAAKGAKDEVEEMLEDIQEQVPKGGLLSGLFGESDDPLAGGKKLDFGELLPDVEETKQQVADFFGGLFERARGAVEEKLVEIREQIGGWWQTLQEDPRVAAVVGFVTGTILPALAQITAFLTQNVPIWIAQVQTFFQEFDFTVWWGENVSPTLQAFADWWNTNWPIIQAVAETAWRVIQSTVMAFVGVLVEEIWPKIQEIIGLLTQQLEESGITWEDVWNSLKQAASIVFGVIGAIILGVIGVVGALINAVVSGVLTAIKMWQEMKAAWMLVFKGLSETFIGLKMIADAIFGGKGFGALFEGLKLMFYGVLDTVGGILRLMVTTFRTFFALIGSIVGGFIEGIVKFFTDLKDRLVGQSIVPDMMQMIFDSITGKLQEAYDWIVGTLADWLQVGKDIVQGLWDGFQEKWEEFKKWLTGAWSKIEEIFNKVTGRSSPPKVFVKAGADTAEAFAMGMSKRLPEVYRSAMEMARTTQRAVAMPASGVQGGIANDNRSSTFNFQITVAGQMDAVAFQNQLVGLLNARG